MRTVATVALGDVTKFVRGVTFKPTDLADDGVGVMRTKNVQHELDLSDIMRVPSRLVKRDEQYLREGDTLVSSANSWYAVGKACWVPQVSEPLAIGGFVTALRPTSSDLDPRYLYRWFTQPRTQATLRSFSNKTTNISNLNLKLAAAMPLPLPPLHEQRRIAAILDHADALRAKRRQALTHLGALAQSVLQDLLLEGFARVDFGDLIADGPKNGLYRPSSDYGSGTPIVRIDSFKFGSSVIATDSLKRLRAPAKHVSEYSLAPGDLVVNRVNSREYVGKTALVGELREPTVFESNMMRIRVDQARLVPVYAAECMQTKDVRRQVAPMTKDAVNQSSINQTDVRSIQIPLPPLRLQREFALRVNEINKQRAVVQRALVADGELFASLQSRAFRGEL